jgi:hypothetical protein
LLQEDVGNVLWTGYDVTERVLNLQDCSCVATSKRFEQVVEGLLFIIHSVIVARIQQDLSPSHGVHLNEFRFVPL